MKSEVTEKAYAYFESGLNCAESVLRSIIESVDGDQTRAFYRLATPFGGGIGGCHEELCGALSGGVMAIGYLAVRNHPEEDEILSRKIAVCLRRRFQEYISCTQCLSVLDRLGPQENSHQCAYLVAHTVGWVIDLLKQYELISMEEEHDESETQVCY
ncbi:C_GCAxxG_C_C family protein [bacterium]|nr:C_GCAxxG_C_C family protein [bacterium]